MERRDASLKFRIVRGCGQEHADAAHPLGLLRARRERPRRRRAAEKGDELAPPDHSITSSARRRSAVGTLRPSAFAVLRLMHQLDLHRLLDRQVGGLGALENAAGVNADLTVRVRNAVSIADQAACHGVLAKWVHRGHRMTRSQCDELLAPAVEEWVTADYERAGSQSGQGCEDRIEVALGARMQDMELQPEGVGRRLHVSRYGLGNGGMSRVNEQGNDGGCGDQLVQHF